MSVLNEGALYGKLLRLKNSRSGFLSTATVKKSEVEALLSDAHIDRVKVKFTEFMVPLENFKEAHILYLSSIQDEACIARCRESFDRLQAVLKDDFVQRVQDWIARAEEVLQLNIQVSPEDSIDEVGFRSASKSSRVSKGSSHSGSRRSSGASSLSAFAAWY